MQRWWKDVARARVGILLYTRCRRPLTLSNYIQYRKLLGKISKQQQVDISFITLLFYQIQPWKKGFFLILPCTIAKGQLISKCIFGVFNFSQKTNKTFQLLGYLRSTCSRSFFWEKLKTLKRHFEINWTLLIQQGRRS